MPAETAPHSPRQTARAFTSKPLRHRYFCVFTKCKRSGGAMAAGACVHGFVRVVRCCSRWLLPQPQRARYFLMLCFVSFRKLFCVALRGKVLCSRSLRARARCCIWGLRGLRDARCRRLEPPPAIPGIVCCLFFFFANHCVHGECLLQASALLLALAASVSCAAAIAFCQLLCFTLFVLTRSQLHEADVPVGYAWYCLLERRRRREWRQAPPCV